MVQVGDPIPSVPLQENEPGNKVNLAEVLKDKKKSILFGLPGAFTPGCSKTHLPGYVKDYEKLVNEKGVDYIGCVSVNDVFVMKAWGEHYNVPQGGIHMLADPLAEFTKALGLEFTHPALGIRSKRWAMVVKDGKVAALNVEPDNTGLSCSLVNEIYKYL